MTFQFQPIGIVHSCFKEKFGIPRQPGLVLAAKATLKLYSPYHRQEALQGLENFSHIWLVFVFHECIRDGWKPMVRPPRLGGNAKVGVFASRSMYRPNPIGLSVVKLEQVITKPDKTYLEVSGVDLLDQTPLLDIKPYVPYSDCIKTATAGYARDEPAETFRVTFSEHALQQVQRKLQQYPGVDVLITQILSRDPRPAYYDERTIRPHFGMKLYDFDLQWEVRDNEVHVLALQDET